MVSQYSTSIFKPFIGSIPNLETSGLKGADSTSGIMLQLPQRAAVPFYASHLQIFSK